MRKTVQTVALAALLLLAPAAAADPSDYKDPFLAGVLSWVMPGAGQIYAHAYTRGSFFVLGEVIDKSALVGLFVYLHGRYPATEGMSAPKISWDKLNDTEKGMILSYAVLSVGFRIYTALDAVHVTRRYNTLTGASAVLIAPDADGVSLAYRRMF